MALLSTMSCIISQRRLLLTASRNFSSLALLASMQSGVGRWDSLRLSRRNGQSWSKAWFYCKVPLHVCRRGGKSVHALHSHMRYLNFCTKLSIENSGEDLIDFAFVWASKNIGGQHAVEEFVSCGVWLLPDDVNFEHVKVGLSPVLKLKVPLPRFPLSHEDEEDDARFLARVEQEARNIVESYTCAEHEACVSGLLNNGHLNHVLKLAWVAYGAHSAPVSTKVLKKRKAEASGKVLVKRPKAPERKGTELAKVSGVRAKGGVKWPSDVDILAAKSIKLSKGIVPRAIASATATCITPKARGSLDSLGTLGSKIDKNVASSKTMLRAKKVTPSAKKCLVPAIGALATISWEGTQESSPRDQAPEVQSKVGLRDQSPERRVQSPSTLGMRSNPEASIPVATPIGAAGASIGYLRFVGTVTFVLVKEVLTLC
jgi:hypothetical protein